MKFLFKLLVVMCVFTSCNTEHDDKYVKDADGNIYRLEWCVGATYYVSPVDIKKIDSLSWK